MAWFKWFKKKVVEPMDANKDGKVSPQEWYEFIAKSEFKSLLMVIISMFLGAFFETLQVLSRGDGWTWDNLLFVCVYMAGPTIIAWLRKQYNTDVARVRVNYEKKEKEFVFRITNLEKMYTVEIDTVETNHRLEVLGLRNTIQQLTLDGHLKQQLIDFMFSGGVEAAKEFITNGKQYDVSKREVC